MKVARALAHRLEWYELFCWPPSLILINQHILIIHLLQWPSYSKVHISGALVYGGEVNISAHFIVWVAIINKYFRRCFVFC